MQRLLNHPGMANGDAPRTVLPPRYQVTERDLRLLADLQDLRYATVDQLSRLHFGHVKLAQRRLRKLASSGLVVRFRPGPITAFGDQRYLYGVSRAGAELVREPASTTPRSPTPTRLPASPPYLAHHELVTDFRIWLRQACSTTPGITCQLVPAYLADCGAGRRGSRAGITCGSARYVPDAVFSLSRSPDRAALFVLEADRGTEPLHRANGTSVEAKLKQFAGALDHGLRSYCERFGFRFRGARMLWLVPDEGRCSALIDLALGLSLAQVVWATLHSELRRPGSLAARIWRVPQRDGFTSLLD